MGQPGFDQAAPFFKYEAEKEPDPCINLPGNSAMA